MKKWIHANTCSATVDRIEIEFLVIDSDIDIEATSSKNNKRVFKNVDRVLKDVTEYLNSKGLSVMDSHQSSIENSDSTYYDIDLRISNPEKNIDFLYFRVADHHISIHTDAQAVYNYYDRITREHEGLDENTDVTGLYHYYPIIVEGKQFNNYDRAINKVKREIDDKLVLE